MDDEVAELASLPLLLLSFAEGTLAIWCLIFIFSEEVPAPQEPVEEVEEAGEAGRDSDVAEEDPVALLATDGKLDRGLTSSAMGCVRDMSVVVLVVGAVVAAAALLDTAGGGGGGAGAVAVAGAGVVATPGVGGAAVGAAAAAAAAGTSSLAGADMVASLLELNTTHTVCYFSGSFYDITAAVIMCLLQTLVTI